MGGLLIDDEHVPSRDLDQHSVPASPLYSSLTLHQDNSNNADVALPAPPYELQLSSQGGHVLPQQSEEEVRGQDSRQPIAPSKFQTPGQMAPDTKKPFSDSQLSSYIESLASPNYRVSAALVIRTRRRPAFAIDVRLRPFTQISSLTTPAKSFLINTPFVGPIYPSVPPDKLVNTISLAVYARYDFASDRMWIAIRQIYMAPTEVNRKQEVKWMRFDQFCSLAKDVGKHKLEFKTTKMWQLFVPNQECCWKGYLNEMRLMALWDRKNIEGQDGFAGDDVV